jgi:hypothetical protein
VSHSYQTYFGFPESDLNLDYGLRNHVITRFESTGLLWRLNGVVVVTVGCRNRYRCCYYCEWKRIIDDQLQLLCHLMLLMLLGYGQLKDLK